MMNFLNLAKEDLDSAELLYRERKYSNALYHYHQSVEKTVKYIGVTIGGISESQLQYEIKHDPIKVFKYLFKHLSKGTENLLPPFNPHILTNAKQLIDSESEENIIKSAWNLIKSIANEEKIIKEENFASPFDALCDYLSNTIPGMDLSFTSNLEKQFVEVSLKNKTIDTIIAINYGTKILEILLINTLICSKYNPDEFRYPNKKTGNPIEHFDENNAFVKDLIFFIDSMKVSIEFIPIIRWNDAN